MIDIERISEKIREEKDNIVAKAFTCQISSLLLTNGIVPIMTEYRKEDIDSITDADRYKLVYELGVTFDSLDTSEHDKQIKVDAINELIDGLHKLWNDLSHLEVVTIEEVFDALDIVMKEQLKDSK